MSRTPPRPSQVVGVLLTRIPASGPTGPLQGAKRLMKHKLIWLLVLLPGLALLGPSATADDTSKGAVSGSVVDSTGAVVPGATVTISRPIGEPVAATDSTGHETMPRLVPGKY